MFVNSGPHGVANFKMLFLLQFSSNFSRSAAGGTFHVRFFEFSLVSFGALSRVKIFIQFQPKFMESMIIRGNTGYYFLGNPPNFESI